MSSRTEGLKAHGLVWTRDWALSQHKRREHERGLHILPQGLGCRLSAWPLKPGSVSWIFSDHPAHGQVLWLRLSQNQITVSKEAGFLMSSKPPQCLAHTGCPRRGTSTGKESPYAFLCTVTCMQVTMELQECVRASGTGVTGDCELPSVAAGHETQISGRAVSALHYQPQGPVFNSTVPEPIG